jgi:hypothetical protein
MSKETFDDYMNRVFHAPKGDAVRVAQSLDAGASVTVCGIGMELARYDVKHGWMVVIDGKDVSLEKLIRQLNFLQASLHALLPEIGR